MFKYKCFIRKNNEFLRETLKKLGYTQAFTIENKENIITGTDGEMSYFTTITNDNIESLSDEFIDCGKSETLFLAIAAMTDEHDKFQFFTTLTDQSWFNLGTYAPKGSLEFCMVTDRYLGRNPLFDSITVPAVKSTIEELFKEFGDKEEDTVWFSKIPEERWKKSIYDFEYCPLTDEEKEMLNDMLTKDNDDVECIFADTYSITDD